MCCQLKILPEAGTKLTAWERLFSRVCWWIQYLRLTTRKLWDDPLLIVRKMRRFLGLVSRKPLCVTNDLTTYCLGLESGDPVRVKSKAGIRATLDDHGRCEGLGYMAGTMDRYCDGIYTVLKRVDLFFDERTQRMLKLKNTVILDRVYCEPAPHGEERFAGCKRMCFLFWKEAWLERVDRHDNAEV